MERYGLTVDLDCQVADLEVGDQQKVELLRVLALGARVLLLDEPTTHLAPAEVDHLFAAVRELASDGVAVVLITHKVREILSLADEITVLRHGRRVAALDGADATADGLVGLVMGVDAAEAIPEAAAVLGVPTGFDGDQPRCPASGDREHGRRRRRTAGARADRRHHLGDPRRGGARRRVAAGRPRRDRGGRRRRRQRPARPRRDHRRATAPPHGEGRAPRAGGDSTRRRQPDPERARRPARRPDARGHPPVEPAVRDLHPRPPPLRAPPTVAPRGAARPRTRGHRPVPHLHREREHADGQPVGRQRPEGASGTGVAHRPARRRSSCSSR